MMTALYKLRTFLLLIEILNSSLQILQTLILSFLQPSQGATEQAQGFSLELKMNK
jgi:hypothetical protein